MSFTESLLRETLTVAVPLWIERLRHEPWEYLQQRAQECSQIVAEKGDIILFLRPKKGETAAAFNALAEGVAILSFAPGGVKFMGLYFLGQKEGEGGDTKNEGRRSQGAGDG